MDRDGWLALSDDYNTIAQQCSAAGDRERAAYWRKAAVAAKQAAEQEQQHAKDTNRSEIGNVNAD